MSVHSVLLFFTGMLPARGWWTAAEGQGINRGWDALCKGLSDIYSLPILPSTSAPESILGQQEGKHCASSKPWPLDLTSGVLVLTFCSDILRPSLLICLCCQLYNLLYNWTYFIQLDLFYTTGPLIQLDHLCLLRGFPRTFLTMTYIFSIISFFTHSDVQ